ncbi:MAG: aromatic ring-hydroxylating dioxygenase subunit alpha [Pigmentiphaga sp.]
MLENKISTALQPFDCIDDRAEEELFRVHSAVYTDESLFDQEKRAFFQQGWVYVAHESELENINDYVARKVMGQPIVLSRGEDGVIRGFFNRCRHRGALVCREERGNARSFVCFYHSWSYRSSGELIGVTGADGFSDTFDLSQLSLTPLPGVESYRGFIFVRLSPGEQALAEHLGLAARYLDLILDKSADAIKVLPGSSQYEYQGNWKLQAENALDYYHVPFIHKSFMDIRRARGERVIGLKNLSQALAVDLGNGHGTVITVSAEGVPQQHLYLFPNLIVLEEPAPQIRVIHPLELRRTRVTGYFFARRDEDQASLLRAYEKFYGPTGFGTPDDMEVFHSCMDGYAVTGSPWNDVSRGLHREETTPPHAWMPPLVSVGNITDDTFLRGFYRHWAERLAKGE